MIYTFKHNNMSYSIVLSKIEAMVIKEQECTEEHILTIILSGDNIAFSGTYGVIAGIKVDILTKMEDN